MSRIDHAAADRASARECAAILGAIERRRYTNENVILHIDRARHAVRNLVEVLATEDDEDHGS